MVRWRWHRSAPTGEAGQSAVEYGLILGLVVLVAALLALPAMRLAAGSLYDGIVNAFAGIGPQG